MHGSMRELMRLKLRAKIYSPFIGLGIILVALGIILGLAEEDPLLIGNHTYSMILGMLSILSGIILYQSEEEFAQKYDMTHLLDIDDKEERYQAYLEHLSEWIATDLEQINPTRTRGSDPSGPDWGKTDFKLGQEPQRRDAIVQGEKYSGMEDDLTKAEKMVADANTKYATMAQKRWEIAEANDPDLIEYGVEKLGDLVKTDYFEKNAESGAFAKVANPDDNTH
ncbi:MAG: hypothetical protein ACPH17_01875 [Candidatus Poseidoniaceae archaeon]